jgi:hypothetical protein
MCRQAFPRLDGVNPPRACLSALAYDGEATPVDRLRARAIVAGWHVDPRRTRRIPTSSIPLRRRRYPPRSILAAQPVHAAETDIGRQVRGEHPLQGCLVPSRTSASPRPSRIALCARPRSPRSWSGSTSIPFQPWRTRGSFGPSGRAGSAATQSTLCAPICSTALMRRRTRRASDAPANCVVFVRSRFQSAARPIGEAAP